jgi:hypothetical protein
VGSAWRWRRGGERQTPRQGDPTGVVQSALPAARPPGWTARTTLARPGVPAVPHPARERRNRERPAPLAAGRRREGPAGRAGLADQPRARRRGPHAHARPARSPPGRSTAVQSGRPADGRTGERSTLDARYGRPATGSWDRAQPSPLRFSVHGARRVVLHPSAGGRRLAAERAAPARRARQRPAVRADEGDTDEGMPSRGDRLSGSYQPAAVYIRAVALAPLLSRWVPRSGRPRPERAVGGRGPGHQPGHGRANDGGPRWSAARWCSTPQPAVGRLRSGQRRRARCCCTSSPTPSG